MFKKLLWIFVVLAVGIAFFGKEPVSNAVNALVNGADKAGRVVRENVDTENIKKEIVTNGGKLINEAGNVIRNNIK